MDGAGKTLNKNDEEATVTTKAFVKMQEEKVNVKQTFSDV